MITWSFPRKLGLAIYFILTLSTSISVARIANPYPVIVLRQGDIYLLESSENTKRITELGDVLDICWLDGQTICFSREISTGLDSVKFWTGLERFTDLFTIQPDGTHFRQFTAHHHARGPAPSPMPPRALFWRDNKPFRTQNEIWESIHPVRRDRPLGIRGIVPDSSPDQRWTAAEVQDDKGEGVGLYRYPTNDSYKKLRGLYRRPRFSPDSKTLAYINSESGQTEIWGYEIPDGEPHRLLSADDLSGRIMDFGYTEDGSGFILVLQDAKGISDVFYWEILQKKLTRLTNFGDVDHASGWH